MSFPERKQTLEQELNTTCVAVAHAIAGGANSIKEVIAKTGLCDVTSARAVRELRKRGDLMVTRAKWFVRDEAWR